MDLGRLWLFACIMRGFPDRPYQGGRNQYFCLT